MKFNKPRASLVALVNRTGPMWPPTERRCRERFYSNSPFFRLYKEKHFLICNFSQIETSIDSEEWHSWFEIHNFHSNAVAKTSQIQKNSLLLCSLFHMIRRPHVALPPLTAAWMRSEWRQSKSWFLRSGEEFGKESRQRKSSRKVASLLAANN